MAVKRSHKDALMGSTTRAATGYRACLDRQRLCPGTMEFRLAIHWSCHSAVRCMRIRKYFFRLQTNRNRASSDMGCSTSWPRFNRPLSIRKRINRALDGIHFDESVFLRKQYFDKKRT